MKYFDLQVNGAFGVDFNDDGLTLEAFRQACDSLHSTGVTGMLPTIITDSLPSMCRRIGKLAGFLETMPQLRQVVRGIHVEGPFLSHKPGFYGAHPPQHVCHATLEATKQLIEAGQGNVRLMTLAPEQDPTCVVIAYLREQGIVVFGGHSDASHPTLVKAISHGLMGYTHLGNGCVHQVDRQDNIMQRVLACRNQLYITLIADGLHVPYWLLESWIGIIGTERCIVISDAISAAGMPPGEYQFGLQNVIVESSRRTIHRETGYLAGSASTMQDMDRGTQGVSSLTASQRNAIFHDNAERLIPQRMSNH